MVDLLPLKLTVLRVLLLSLFKKLRKEKVKQFKTNCVI